MSFIGCTICYRKKKNCRCNFGDFHRIPERHFEYWKFELVQNACGKVIRTSRTDRNDALHCGDIDWEDIAICEKCREAHESVGDRNG